MSDDRRRVRRRDRSQQASSQLEGRMNEGDTPIDSPPSDQPATSFEVQSGNRNMNLIFNEHELQEDPDSSVNNIQGVALKPSITTAATPQPARSFKTVTTSTATSASYGIESELKPSTPPMSQHTQNHHNYRPQLHVPVDMAPDSNNTSSTASPGTPFRFETFPASLPRVHPRKDAASQLHLFQHQEQLQPDNQIQEHSQYAAQVQMDFTPPASPSVATTLPIHRKTPFQSPLISKYTTTAHRSGSSTRKRKGSIRKRMVFADPDFSNDEECMYSHSSGDNDAFHNSYRDDSHNTSLSSLSVDGTISQYNHQGKPTTTITPVRTQPLSFGRSAVQTPFTSSHRSGFDRNESHGTSVITSAATNRAVWLSPILSDEKLKPATGGKLHTSKNENLNQKEEKQFDPRTRLNFNSLFSPSTDNPIKDTGDDEPDDNRRTVARKRNSFSDYDQFPHYDGK
jgi:hypothetical protein